MEADYLFGYQRTIILECQEDNSGQYFVRRLEENKSNPRGNVCCSFKTLDSNEEDEYLLETDNGSDQVDVDGFSKNYVTVAEQNFVIQKEDCNFSMLTQGELGLGG